MLKGKLSILNRKSKIQDRGFTLIEAIIVIFLLGIISGIVAVVVNTSFKIMGGIQGRKTMVMEGSISIGKFSREFSQIIDENSLLYADDKKIRFSIGQGVILEYELDSGSLFRKIVGQGQRRLLTQSANTSSSKFGYFESNNNQLTNLPLSAQDLKKVWVVELTLNLSGQEQTIAFLADVFPENFKIVPTESGEAGGLGAPPPPPPGF